MSREGTNVFGVVVVTMCVTAVGLLGGYLGVTKYLEQNQAVSPASEVPVEAPAPRRSAQRPRRNENGEAGQTVAAIEPQAADAAADQGVGAVPDSPVSGPVPEATLALLTEVERAAEPSAPAPRIPDEPGNDDARSIMEEVQRRAEAGTYQYDGRLQAFDANGKASEKRWTFERLGSNGRSKAVLRFTAPAEVVGVALLIHNHPERASDQWMWTPALERDRRIALQDRSTRFFGTDFSFEDLEERDVEQYDFTMLGSDTINGVACWKIEMTPKRTRASQYSKSIGWVRKDNYVIALLDNYVRDEVVKRMTAAMIENVEGIWTPRQLDMADLRRGTHTRLTLQQVNYNEAMNDRSFTLQAISR